MRASLPARCLLALLLAQSGCSEIRFGYESGNRFAVPAVPVAPGSQAAVCFDELTAADADIEPDLDGWHQVSLLGSMSEAEFRKQERYRQQDWDERYCRRQAECHTLAVPDVSVSDVAERVEVCLKNRAQRRVAMEL